MEEQDLILLKKFMEKIWPGYRNNVYRALYSTYHPSTYNEGFSNPMDNMMVATDEIDVAITKGENYGLIDKLTGYKFPDSPEFYIDEGTNSHRHPWMVSTLLFNVLWDIVEEFRCYCGEGGVDPDCKGKCIGDFPYLYEDYNSLHDYMEELQDLGAPLDILLDEYPLQLNKIQLVPDYPYRPHEHGHGMRLTEDIDKFLSRRLSVVRENIYTLSNGNLLGESDQHKLENQMCELFNIHKHESSEHLFNWSIKDVIKEHKALNEETDIFGQGLLDPIAPEEFEGTEEEWEELISKSEPGEKEKHYFGDYEYTDGKTDAKKGFVAPSKEVTENICTVENFCREQGPITFGQLKALVETATSKRIQADMGRGAFKMLWRIIPFFIPQILLAAVGITATRAFNKIITPALKDTRGYKNWWGKVVLKAMDIAEGDYIPDVAIGDDPLGKVFFVSDGLLQMIKDKYKLKFARYVAEVAAARPDNEPVPDWFVENLLRDYLNQKFLLDPPLQPKKGIEFEELRTIDESAPLPGETSDKGMDTTNLTPVSKKKMTLEEILEEIDDIAYYEDVVVDLEKGDKSWDVTKQVLKYSDYWIKNPNSLTSPDFPPINVIIPNKLNDGSHRISTLYALANHIDSDNPYWSEVKLPVHFYDPKDVITEHEEPGLSPELEIGDVIKVVDIDREVENNSIKYNIAPPELRPEKFTPYAVVDKESNGSESKYPFRYTLVPEDKLEDYEKNLDRGYGDYEGYEKLLFPWVHQWIYADTPMANKVDRLTISEHTKRELNPELEKGDHVKIISIDGEHANMPKRWEIYVVNTVSKDTYKDQKYYGLYPIDQTDEQLTSSMLAGGGKQRELYLYRGDEWIKVEKESPLIKKLDGMEVEIDTVKYDLGWVDEDTGDATGNQFFEISNPRFAPISYGGDSPIRKDLFKYDLIFREEESGVLERFFTREELERMLNQQGIKDKLEKAIYENYLKLYGMRKPYIKLETVFADDDTDKVLSENILDTFKVISELNTFN